jgi:hypothetical protein
MMGRFPKRRPMIVYVVTVDDRATVAFKAESQSEARGLPKEDWFRRELKRKRSSGTALWNGSEKLKVRAATGEEAASVASKLSGDLSLSESLPMAYLIELDL